MRLTGAVLVLGCTTWLGLRAAWRLRQKARHLEDLEAGLLRIEQELELSAPLLTELMEELTATSRGCAAALFAGCLRGLRESERSPFSQIWREELEKQQELDLDSRRCLEPLGNVLGRYSGEKQRQAISGVRTRLEELRRAAEAQVRSQGKVYQVLGLSGGAFFLILLL